MSEDELQKLHGELAQAYARVATLERKVAAIENMVHKRNEQKTTTSVTEVLADLDSELSSKLALISEDEVRATEYFRNKDDWNTINKLLKSHGFKWISAGKQSCWRRQ